MNSLNILSAIGSTPPPSPAHTHTASEGDIARLDLTSSHTRGRGHTEHVPLGQDDTTTNEDDAQPDENTPPIARDAPQPQPEPKSEPEPAPTPLGDPTPSIMWVVPKRIVTAFIGGFRAVLAVVVAPARYLAAYFYDKDGRFFALLPVYRVGRMFSCRKRGRSTHNVGHDEAQDQTSGPGDRQAQTLLEKPSRRSPWVSSIANSAVMTSDSESEPPPARHEDSPARKLRSKSSVDEISPARRSIRIKLHTEDALRKRKARRGSRSSHAGGESTPHEAATVDSAAAAAAAASIKPPGSPGFASKLKFPRAPLPPRPLVPRRQPSYSDRSASSNFGPHEKTLVLDLDETLIHSMAKGGRYTSGHMVEVKLHQAVGAGNQTIASQVPILYYVHKRPHCDDFLRKVSRWYNLIIFTASVQEYADPVIDWLELERKYFTGRYYRQHCTLRNGAYIKDLSQVEPDLSKVMIVDNSPMSYIFHEDNAIPIEGWISDPTDNDLLHLIPLLEGLQHVTDLRALLALRLGEPPATS